MHHDVGKHLAASDLQAQLENKKWCMKRGSLVAMAKFPRFDFV